MGKLIARYRTCFLLSILLFAVGTYARGLVNVEEALEFIPHIIRVTVSSTYVSSTRLAFFCRVRVRS